MSKVDPFVASNGPALVQNRKSQVHFLFGKAPGADGHGSESAADHETIEMKQLKRRAHKKDSSSSPPPEIEKDGDTTYVIHVVEPHHTLRGIALQYRVPAEEIKRLNMMWTDDELHTRKKLKIPVDPNGIIYYAVMNNKLDELLDQTAASDSPHTHTTKNLLKPTDVLPKEPSDSEHSTSAQFLEKLDEQLNLVMKSQERLASEFQHSNNNSVTIAPRVVRKQVNPLVNLMPQDWRSVVILLLVVAVVVPAIFYVIEPLIVAPPPHKP